MPRMLRGRGGWVPYAGKRTQIRGYRSGRGFWIFLAALVVVLFGVIVAASAAG